MANAETGMSRFYTNFLGDGKKQEAPVDKI